MPYKNSVADQAVERVTAQQLRDMDRRTKQLMNRLAGANALIAEQEPVTFHNERCETFRRVHGYLPEFRLP